MIKGYELFKNLKFESINRGTIVTNSKISTKIIIIATLVYCDSKSLSHFKATLYCYQSTSHITSYYMHFTLCSTSYCIRVSIEERKRVTKKNEVKLSEVKVDPLLNITTNNMHLIYMFINTKKSIELLFVIQESLAFRV